MGRAQFEYDEVGNTFYYVLVSFYALVLIPATFFFWPTSKLGWYFTICDSSQEHTTPSYRQKTFDFKQRFTEF